MKRKKWLLYPPPLPWIYRLMVLAVRRAYRERKARVITGKKRTALYYQIIYNKER